MTTLNSFSTQVLIIGAGPTGLTLANLLGQAHVDTLIIDRKAGTVTEPRAVSIDDESLRTMQAIGLDDAVLRDVVPGYGVHYFTARAGVALARSSPPARCMGFPNAMPFASRCSNTR